MFRTVLQRCAICFLGGMFLACVWLLALPATLRADEPEPREPTSLDPRLVIERIAAEPDIVTPTGIAVDASGRVLVIESHTHFPPPDYAGPPHDRIRAIVDADGDGTSERVSTFFEGSKMTMNLAVYEDGSVFVATRNEIFRLADLDDDGRAERNTPIAHMETLGNYPHNGLSGFAFDALGNVYFGMGENLGADYRLIGSDGASVSGGGEGGSIYRCRPDGTGLTRLATGYWNPFHLCFDAFDRLFAVDNDPDSRPPCRLLHIVPHGDYGYRYRNGRKGIHPFTAWNGELPGTLPMAAGTGEAPSGVLAYESDALPEEYRGALLGTSWGDHRIERFRMKPRGASFRAVAETIITGGDNFRPVGIAPAPDGSLYVSDWVDKSYTLHGLGRVWRIRAKDAKPQAHPADSSAALTSAHRLTRQSAVRELAQTADKSDEQVIANLAQLAETATGNAQQAVRADALLGLARAARESKLAGQRLHEVAGQIAASDAPAGLRAIAVEHGNLSAEALGQLADNSEDEVRAAALRRLTQRPASPKLLAALADADPFVRQAARLSLAAALTTAEQLELARSPQIPLRLGAVLMLRESKDPAARQAIAPLLSDDDPWVRFSAVEWVATDKLGEFRDVLAAGMATGATTRTLFEAYLAALERLDGVVRGVSDESSGDQYVLKIVLDPQAPAVLRARALRALAADHPSLTLEVLSKMVEQGDAPLAREAVRTLRERAEPEAVEQLARIVADPQAPVELRAEAIVGLPADNPQRTALLLGLATGKEPVLRREALRSLRGADLDPVARRRLTAATAGQEDPELVSRLLATEEPKRPDKLDTAAWQKLAANAGDAAAGERVFFHRRGPACYRCHQVDGRGGAVGPDLSSAARSLTGERLLESLLQPSKEIAPQFTQWSVVRTDGTTLSGILLAEQPDGARLYGTAEGQTVLVAADEVSEVHPRPASIMPDNLCQMLTPGELADLLAYLRQAR